MIKTPLYNLGRFPNVYEPREDTFLFLDALQADSDYLKNVNPKVVVEIGSGSGVIISALYQLFGEFCVYYATDINPECCLATKNTQLLNNSRVEIVSMDLLSNFKRNLFDLIVFNPPYVVTDCNELDGVGLNRSWAGGCKGREIIDKVINNLSGLLAPNGVCYMLLLKENGVEDVVNVAKKSGFRSELVMQRKIPGEHLFVYKFFM